MGTHTPACLILYIMEAQRQHWELSPFPICFLFIYMYVYVYSMCVQEPQEVRRGTEKPLELKWQTIAFFSMQILWSEFKSSGRAASHFNHWATSPVSLSTFFNCLLLFFRWHLSLDLEFISSVWLFLLFSKPLGSLGETSLSWGSKHHQQYLPDFLYGYQKIELGTSFYGASLLLSELSPQPCMGILLVEASCKVEIASPFHEPLTSTMRNKSELYLLGWRMSLRYLWLRKQMLKTCL